MTKPRKLKNWLTSYLAYTSAQESPQIYHLWSGISVISAMLGRKCFYDQRYFKFYPNHYIVIVGNSGKYKKSTAGNVALDLYNAIEVKDPVRSRKITGEALMQNLGLKFEKTGTASAYVFNSELSVFVGRNSDKHGLIDIMTEAYDCTSLVNETKGAGTDKIENVFVNWLACTTPQDLNRMSGIMVDGGLAGRVIFIATDEKGTPVHNVKQAAERIPDIDSLRDDLIYDLRTIKEITGEFVITKEADAFHKTLYDANYHREDFPLKLAPYQQRKGAHLIKLAMIVSAAQRSDRIISLDDMEISSELLSQAERGMPIALSGLPYLESSQQMEILLGQVTANGGRIGHSELLRKNCRHMDTKIISQIMYTLRDAGIIDIETNGNKKIYKKIAEGSRL